MAPEISRRISSILDAVEREASRLREEAQNEANRYFDAARRQADELVAERRRRISELSGELVVKSEAVVARLDDAAPVRQGFENLVRALGDAAERLSVESHATNGSFNPPSFHEAARQPAQAPQPPQSQAAPGGHLQQQAPGPYPPQPHPSPPPGVPAGFVEQPYPSTAPSQPAWQPTPTPSPAGPAMPANPPARGVTRQELDDARMIAIQLAGAGGTRADVRGHLNRALGIVDAEPTLDEIFGPGTGEDARVPWTTSRR
jgi:hypothetical protein